MGGGGEYLISFKECKFIFCGLIQVELHAKLESRNYKSAL